jgi:hypothetical protein
MTSICFKGFKLTFGSMNNLFSSFEDRCLVEFEYRFHFWDHKSDHLLNFNQPVELWAFSMKSIKEHDYKHGFKY